MTIALSSIQLVMSLAGLIVLLLLVIWAMRKLFHSRNPIDFTSKSRNKYSEVDSFKLRPAFLQVGMASALLVAILAFGWTSANSGNGASFEIGEMEADIEQLPPRTVDLPKPLPPPPTVIEEVEEEKMIEEEEVEFVDMSITDEDEVTAYEQKKKPEPIPEKAPVIIEEDEGSEIFIRAEEMPSMEACFEVSDRSKKWACTQQAMLQFVYKNIKYPPIARENGVQGTVVAAFVIDQDGQLADVELLRDIGAGCGEEVKRIVDLLNSKVKWSPGRQRGMPVKVRVTLPVKFKLE